jgi:phospholipase/carboxylesterase
MNDEDIQLSLAHIVRPAREMPRGDQNEGTPGILLLHGLGADEADLMGLEGALDPRFTVVSARAPYRYGPGFAWFALQEVGQPDGDTLRASVEALHTFIPEMAQTYSIDPARIFLLGFSQGAIISSAVALTLPQVRGVVMHSGYVAPSALVSGNPRLLKGKPFFVAHGRYDDLIPISFGRATEEYLSSHGARLTYHEYPIGHSISEESLYELNDWLTSELDAL